MQATGAGSQQWTQSLRIPSPGRDSRKTAYYAGPSSCLQANGPAESPPINGAPKLNGTHTANGTSPNGVSHGKQNGWVSVEYMSSSQSVEERKSQQAVRPSPRRIFSSSGGDLLGEGCKRFPGCLLRRANEPNLFKSSTGNLSLKRLHSVTSPLSDEEINLIGRGCTSQSIWF
jgi:hypothetical protein